MWKMWSSSSSVLFLFSLCLVLFVCFGSSFSYSGNLMHSQYNVGDAEQVAVSYGPSSQSCSVYWVSILTPQQGVEYESFSPRDGDNASAYFAEVIVGFDCTQEKIETGAAECVRYTGYASVWTESRCGTPRLLHNVVIPQCAKEFEYRVRTFQQVNTSSDGTQAIFVGINNLSPSFQARVPLEQQETKVCLLADLNAGYQPNSIGSISNAVDLGQIDLCLHSGDIAYDIDDDCGRNGDSFFQATQNITSQIPYIFGVGDHEGGRADLPDDCSLRTGYDYESYRMRMGEAVWGRQLYLSHRSGSLSTFYFSFDIGLIHFAVINTEVYVYGCFYWMIEAQYIWLRADLARVDREKTPWVIVVGHRSAYCTKSTDTECNNESQSIRDGLPAAAYHNNLNIYDQFMEPVPNNHNLFGLEDLFHLYGVDIYFSGHTHHYERSWPVYKEKPQKFSSIEHYKSPEHPVYIVSGIAGVSPDIFSVGPADWTAFRDENYTEVWGKVTAYNDSYFEYIAVAASDDHVVDSFYITKSSSEPSSMMPIWGTFLIVIGFLVLLLAPVLIYKAWEMKKKSEFADE